MSLCILAFDPGGTTGWACSQNQHGQLEPWEVWTFLTYHRPLHLVVESFLRAVSPNRDLTPVKVIGVIEEWARQNEIPITFQTPSQAKHFFTDERLKERGVYYKGEQHARDAARHLLYFQTFGEGIK